MPPQLLSLKLRSLIIPASLIFLKIIFSNDNPLTARWQINTFETELTASLEIVVTDVLTWPRLAFHLVRKIRQKKNFQVYYQWLRKDEEGVVTHRPRS